MSLFILLHGELYTAGNLSMWKVEPVCRPPPPVIAVNLIHLLTLATGGDLKVLISQSSSKLQTPITGKISRIGCIYTRDSYIT